ncbi:MAG: hypothetical protein JOZ54_08860, partial [Acidobacteria bacterium]|nr:hypothetical protein [Acidobacteriota bacterium]
NLDPRSDVSAPVTRTVGAAVSPAPSPDGRLFFMSLQPDGFELRVLAAQRSIPEGRAVEERTQKMRVFDVAQLGAPKNYGIGKQEIDWLAGGSYARDLHAVELGARIGDAVGRLDTVILGSIGGDFGMRGGSIASTFRGWPVEIGAQIFSAKEREASMRGGVLRAMKSMRWPLTNAYAQASLVASRLDGGSRNLAYATAGVQRRQIFGPLRTSESVQLEGAHGDATYAGGVADVNVQTNSYAMHFAYERRHANGDAGSPYDRLSVGGLPSSIVPDEVLASRVFEPAYEPFALVGDRYEGRRVDVTYQGLTVFWQQHLMNDEDRKLAGIERTFSSPPIPIVNLPAADITVGVARLLDDHRTRFWFGLRWRP